MLLDDLDYNLPPHRIAQEPLPERDASRLLVVRRADGALADRAFRDITALVEPGDVLVLNDTRVIPARLAARKPDTGAHIDVTLLEETARNEWDVLVRPGRRVHDGTRLVFERAGVRVPAIVTAVGDGGQRRILFQCEGDVRDALDTLGRSPLPPYIKREELRPADRERYQTVYAREPGAAAAPTAGLHFTPALLDAVRARGAIVAFATLHVGLGTFEPLTDEHLRTGRLHEERFELPAEAAVALNRARAAGRRIIAVGTTVVRLLETAYADDAREPFAATAGRTDLFLKPGDRFRAVDALVTNFHLPRSSLLALVCAFAGRELTLRAYDHAIRGAYRFYSYGDAMFIA